MTDSAAPPPKRRPSRGRTRAVAVVAGSAVLILAGGLILAYAARREIAREAVLGWLRSRGVQAELRFETLTERGFIATLRAGPADDPDLSVQRVEVDTATAWPWARGGFQVRPTRIRLVRPLVKAQLKDGSVRFGSLDPLVREYMKRPPQPGVRGPLVQVEDGRVRLDTPYGVLTVHGGATVDDGRLLAADAQLAPTRLNGRDLSADIGGGTLRLRTDGERTRVAARLRTEEWTSPTLTVERGEADLEADLPYPDAKSFGRGGPASVRAGLRAAALTQGETALRNAELNLALGGTVQGWIQDLRFGGSGRAVGRALSAGSGDLDARDLRFDLRAQRLSLTRDRRGLDWRAEGGGLLGAGRARRADAFVEGVEVELASARLAGRGADFESAFHVRPRIERLGQGDLSLRGVTGDLQGEARRNGATAVELTGGIKAAHGAWTGFGGVTRADDKNTATLKRALADFRFEVPAFALEAGSPGMTLALNAPLRAAPASGGLVTVAQVGRTPLYSEADGSGRGALRIESQGGALPEARATVSSYTLTNGRAGPELRAELATTARFGFGPVSGGAVDAAGRLTLVGDAATFTGARCASLVAERLDLGENDVTGFKGRLCPTGTAPLLRVEGGGWRVVARAESVEAAVPLLETRITDATAEVDAAGETEPVRADVRLSGATLNDTAAERRFQPLGLAGGARLANGRWAGDFDLSAKGTRVARLDLSHTLATGRGGVTIDGRGILFREGGLQPVDLSPAVAPFGSKFAGKVDFTGRADWTPGTMTSSGRLTTSNLAFQSAAGPVTNLATDVQLTSLAPLVSAPGQTVTVQALQSAIPAQRAEAKFQLTADALHVEEAGFEALQGRVSFEPFAIPLAEGESWEGAARLHGIQLGPLIEATSLGDRIDFQAKLSGRLPFVIGPAGVQFVEGRLAADEPGRLSIDRTVLTGVQAGGETPGGVAGLPYQALEDLAFSELDATVNSLPKGRLGVLFHIKGRHEPAKRQEIKLTWADLLRAGALATKKDLPLPSGTEVNLTLDTSWNLGDLIESLRRAAEAPRSQPVQPPGG